MRIIKNFFHTKTVPLLLLALLIVIPLTMTALKKGRFYLQNRAAEPKTESDKSKVIKPPEYAPGEVIVKFKINTPKILVKLDRSKQNVTLESQSVNIEDIEPSSLPKIFTSLSQTKKISKIQKVFRGAEEPEKELAKFKSKFSKEIAVGKRKVNEGEFLKIDFSKTYKLSFDKSSSVFDLVKELSQSPDVEYAEPNYIYQAQLTPNDPEFSKQWGLNNTGQEGGKVDADINAPEAWDVTTGSESIVVGVIDTGIDYNHEDLKDNIWTNPGEIPGNNIDDDNNGYIDDIHGWDFANNTNDPMDKFGHGTHVAGIISASGNNGKGVTGIAWKVKLMALKFLDVSIGDSIGAAQAIEYSTRMGAKITNNSWGGLPYSQTLYDAIFRASAVNTLFVAAAGNSSSDIDKNPFFPASYNIPSIISVFATDNQDNRAYFSSYGLTSVDIGAPGNSIWSTYPDNQYSELSGTSMASPLVAGVVALLYSNNQGISNLEIKELIENTSDSISFVRPLKSGRLNASRALSAKDFPPISDLSSPIPYDNLEGIKDIIGIAKGSTFSEYTLEMGLGSLPTEWIAEGITLENEGKRQVDGVILGTLNTKGYQPGLWTLKLTVVGNNGTKSVERVLVNIEKPKELGQAIAIPKGENFVLVPATSAQSSLNFEYPLTIEVWIRTENNYSSILSNKVIRGDGLSSYPLYDFYKDSSFISFWHSKGNLGNHSVFLKTLSQDSWYHFALTTDGNEPKIFLNGEKLATNISVRDINPIINQYLSLEIGKGGSGKFIDELRISKAVRDIEANWKNGDYFKSLPVDKDTVGLWHFEGNLLDSSSYENSGVQNGKIFYYGPTLAPSPNPTPTNSPPRILAVNLIPTNLTVGDTLLINVDSLDPDPKESITVQVSIVTPDKGTILKSGLATILPNGVWRFATNLKLTAGGTYPYTATVTDKTQKQVVKQGSFKVIALVTPTPTKTSTKTPTKTPTPKCKPSIEICDKKDNDCDNLVDEGNVCKIPTKTSGPVTQ